MTDPLVDFTVSRLPDRVVIGLRGEVDLSNTALVEHRVTAEAGQRLVIDLSDLSYLDSAGLHLLYRLVQGAGGAHGVTVVAPPGCRARAVIDLAGVAGSLAVRDSVPATGGVKPA